MENERSRARRVRSCLSHDDTVVAVHEATAARSLTVAPIVVSTGGPSQEWLHRKSLVLHCITCPPPQIIINHSATCDNYKIQVVQEQHESEGISLQLKRKASVYPNP